MKKNISYWIGGVMVVLAIVYGAITSCHGLLLSDTGYYISRYAASDFWDVYRPFSQWCYKILVGVFGDKLIVQRLFAWIIYTIGIIIPASFLTDIRRRPLLISVATTMSLLFFPLADIGELAFNGNGLSVLTLSCTFVALYKYMQKPVWHMLLFLILSLCVCILSRLPNIIVICFIVVVLPIIGDTCQSRLYICGAIIISLIICFGVYLLMYGGLDNIYNAITVTYASQDGVGEADHSIKALLAGYLNSLKDIISQLKYLFIFAFIVFIGCLCKRKKYAVGIVSVSAVFFVYILFARLQILHFSEWSLFVFAAACAMMPYLVACILGVIRGDWKTCVWSLLPICFSVCAAAGSAGGLYLMAMPLYAFIPFILYQLSESLPTISKDEAVRVLIGLLGLALCCALYVRQGMQFIGIIAVVLVFLVLFFMRRIAICPPNNLSFVRENADFSIKCCVYMICLALGIIFVCNTMCKRCHGGVGLLECNHTIDNPKMKGIRVSKNMADYLTEVLESYFMAKEPIVFYGKSMWFFDYLTGNPTIKKVEFSCSDKHLGNLSAFKSIVDEKRPVCFLTAEYAGAEDVPTRYPIINDYLIERGYKCEKHMNFAVYYPIDMNEK